MKRLTTPAFLLLSISWSACTNNAMTLPATSPQTPGSGDGTGKTPSPDATPRVTPPVLVTPTPPPAATSTVTPVTPLPSASPSATATPLPPLQRSDVVSEWKAEVPVYAGTAVTCLAKVPDRVDVTVDALLESQDPKSHAWGLVAQSPQKLTHTVARTLIGQPLRCRAVAHTPQGDLLGESTPPVDVANRLAMPFVPQIQASGLRVGQTLTCANTPATDPDGDPLTPSFRWTSGGREIALGERLTVTSAWAHAPLQCWASVFDGHASTPESASAPITVENSPPTAPVAVASLTTPALLESTSCLPAQTPSDPDGDVIGLRTQWEIETSTGVWTPLQLATEAFTPRLEHLGRNVRCTLVARDGFGAETWGSPSTPLRAGLTSRMGARPWTSLLEGSWTPKVPSSDIRSIALSWQPSANQESMWFVTPMGLGRMDGTPRRSGGMDWSASHIEDTSLPQGSDITWSPLDVAISSPWVWALSPQGLWRKDTRNASNSWEKMPEVSLSEIPLTLCASGNSLVLRTWSRLIPLRVLADGHLQQGVPAVLEAPPGLNAELRLACSGVLVSWGWTGEKSIRIASSENLSQAEVRFLGADPGATLSHLSSGGGKLWVSTQNAGLWKMDEFSRAPLERLSGTLSSRISATVLDSTNTLWVVGQDQETSPQSNFWIESTRSWESLAPNWEHKNTNIFSQSPNRGNIRSVALVATSNAWDPTHGGPSDIILRYEMDTLSCGLGRWRLARSQNLGISFEESFFLDTLPNACAQSFAVSNTDMAVLYPAASPGLYARSFGQNAFAKTTLATPFRSIVPVDNSASWAVTEGRAQLMYRPNLGSPFALVGGSVSNVEWLQRDETFESNGVLVVENGFVSRWEGGTLRERAPMPHATLWGMASNAEGRLVFLTSNGFYITATRQLGALSGPWPLPPGVSGPHPEFMGMRSGGFALASSEGLLTGSPDVPASWEQHAFGGTIQSLAQGMGNLWALVQGTDGKEILLVSSNEGLTWRGQAPTALTYNFAPGAPPASRLASAPLARDGAPWFWQGGGIYRLTHATTSPQNQLLFKSALGH